MNKEIILIVLAVVAVIVLYVVYRKNFKLLNTPNFCLVTGGVKCGKSMLSVYLAIKKYRKIHRSWWWATHVFKKDVEEPLFYTNICVSFGNLLNGSKHKLDRCIVKLDTPLLLRKARFAYKSVILIDEGSLMADNMDFKDKERNIDLSLWCKLVGHETHGGYVFVNTQSPLDMHYSFKRVVGSYYFSQTCKNFGLFSVLYVRELINSESGVNAFDDDIENTMRKVLIPFWYRHKYDRFEFSYFTDDLHVAKDEFKPKSGLSSFNPLYVERCNATVLNRKSGGKDNVNNA